METKNLDIIYQSEKFTLYPDRVIQQKFEGRALDRQHIISNYKSQVTTNYPSVITFKFSINGKDNETKPGLDHQLVVKPVNGQYVSPVITFGRNYREVLSPVDNKFLPANTSFTIRLDLREMQRQFQEKGYFTTYNGEKIQASEFKGVFIAGGPTPLSWDFDNLVRHPDYQLHDENNDGIYEATFILNAHDIDEKPVNEWKLRHDISKYPEYQSEQLLIDALHNLSLDETIMLIEKDDTFRTGAEWPGVWTRDVAYSILLAYAFLEPEVSKTSLLQKVKRGRIVQDIGSGGAWPVSTDRVVWALAAWEIYLVTGDTDWLVTAFPIIRNTVEDDLGTVRDASGLFKGESSFLDWREQTYPAWMDNVDISQSLCLGTNIVYFRTFEILSLMSSTLGLSEDAEKYRKLAQEVKVAIDTHLWDQDKGYYHQYWYGRSFMQSSDRSETLGEAFTVLFDVADANRAKRVVSRSPMVPYGAPCIYPQIPNISAYHNNGIWPFVQGFWNWAAKKAGNESALVHGLASLSRATALFLTNKENFVAEDGDFMGTQINSDRQLWSVAGNLAMVYRVFLGFEFQPDKLCIRPFVPETVSGFRSLKGFKYRNALLDFEINGFGDQIEEMTINGTNTKDFEIPGNLQGHQKVVIQLNNHFKEKSTFNLVENRFSPASPEVSLSHTILKWDRVKGASKYQVLYNGDLIHETSDTQYIIHQKQFGYYSVVSVDRDQVKSFSSEPIAWFPDSHVLKVDLDRYRDDLDKKLIDYTGKGYVKISRLENMDLSIPVRIHESGRYLVSLRYSNGSGPLNTDNKCAIRTLCINGNKLGTLVMAQRGEGEWSNWGYTNLIEVFMPEGDHHFQIVLQPDNENMNGDENTAIIDHIRLVKIS